MDTDQVPVLVPDDKDITDLTIGELDYASRQIKADVLECVAGQVPGMRYTGLAHLVWLWARRLDKQAKLAPILDYTFEELMHAGGMDREAAPDPTAGEAATSPSPEPA